MHRDQLMVLLLSGACIVLHAALWTKAERCPELYHHRIPSLSRLAIASSLVFAILGAIGRRTSAWLRFESDLAERMHTTGVTSERLGHLESFALMVFALGAALWLGHLVITRRREVAFFGVAVLGVGFAVLEVVKSLVAVSRPGDVDAIALSSTWEFPSGHIFGISLLAALAVSASRARGGRRRLLAIIAASVVAGTGALRLALGHHYLGDVLAGSALALMWFTLCESARLVLRAETTRTA